MAIQFKKFCYLFESKSRVCLSKELRIKLCYVIEMSEPEVTQYVVGILVRFKNTKQLCIFLSILIKQYKKWK